MAGWAARTAVRKSLAQVRYVTPVSPESAQRLVGQVYLQLERDFGVLAPPVALHSPAPTALAASWLMLRETLLAAGRVDRTAKEAIASGVSLGNVCPYCVDVHSTTLQGLVGGRDAAAIASDRISSVTDPITRRLTTWARTSGVRDRTGQPQMPFSAEQAPEFVGVAVTFHYLNRMVNVFLDGSPIPVAVPDPVRGGLRRLLGLVMGSMARRAAQPGTALTLLPAAELPEDLLWTTGNPSVAGAFARAVAAIEELGSRATSPAVRDLVATKLTEWDGLPPGLNRAWTNDSVAALPYAERPAGRLAILTALASYQVDQSVVDEFRRDRPDDETLIGLTSWASLAAARRVGSLL